MLNPKTALFFLAFLPQFVDRSRGGVTAQMLILGAWFACLGVVSDGAYCLLASAARERLLGRPGLARLRARLSGAVLVSLGVLAAVGGRRPAT